MSNIETEGKPFAGGEGAATNCTASGQRNGWTAAEGGSATGVMCHYQAVRMTTFGGSARRVPNDLSVVLLSEGGGARASRVAQSSTERVSSSLHSRRAPGHHPPSLQRPRHGWDSRRKQILD